MVSLSSSSRNSIAGNNITNNEDGGIFLSSSSNNSIHGNGITNNDYGIDLHRSSNNSIAGNNITNNEDGVHLYRSSNNSIHGNSITANNEDGIHLFYSDYNTIYHNNFINNTNQVYSYNSTNVWDDGYPSGGNYWSDHVCTGNPSDGSQPYIVDANNIDHYPFQDPNGWLPKYTLTVYSSPTGVTFTVDGVSRTTPWSGTYSEGTSVILVMPEIHTVGDVRYYWNQWSDGNTSRTRTVTMNTNIMLTAVFACTFDVVLDDIHYPVSILSNSTVSNFNFSETEMQISFDVAGESGTTGYCNVTISKSLLKGSPWTIKVDDTPITDFDEKTNDTHTFLYFTYTHESPLQVTIEGTWVVPEFPSTLILPLLMIATLLAIIIHKKEQTPQ